MQIKKVLNQAEVFKILDWLLLRDLCSSQKPKLLAAQAVATTLKP